MPCSQSPKGTLAEMGHKANVNQRTPELRVRDEREDVVGLEEDREPLSSMRSSLRQLILGQCPWPPDSLHLPGLSAAMTSCTRPASVAASSFQESTTEPLANRNSTGAPPLPLPPERCQQPVCGEATSPNSSKLSSPSSTPPSRGLSTFPLSWRVALQSRVELPEAGWFVCYTKHCGLSRQFPSSNDTNWETAALIAGGGWGEPSYVESLDHASCRLLSVPGRAQWACVEVQACTYICSVTQGCYSPLLHASREENAG